METSDEAVGVLVRGKPWEGKDLREMLLGLDTEGGGLWQGRLGLGEVIDELRALWAKAGAE